MLNKYLAQILVLWKAKHPVQLRIKSNWEKAETILKAIQHVNSIYKKRSFNVSTINLDGEFANLKDELLTLNINLNVTANNEHVPVAER